MSRRFPAETASLNPSERHTLRSSPKVVVDVNPSDVEPFRQREGSRLVAGAHGCVEAECGAVGDFHRFLVRREAHHDDYRSEDFLLPHRRVGGYIHKDCRSHPRSRPSIADRPGWTPAHRLLRPHQQRSSRSPIRGRGVFHPPSDRFRPSDRVRPRRLVPSRR